LGGECESECVVDYVFVRELAESRLIGREQA